MGELDRITIEYTPEFKDYIPTRKICNCQVFLWIDKIFAALFLVYGIYLLSLNSSLLFLFFVLELLSWFDLFGLFFLWLKVNTNPQFKTSYLLKVTDDGILMRTSTLESNIKWDFSMDLKKWIIRSFYYLDGVDVQSFLSAVSSPNKTSVILKNCLWKNIRGKNFKDLKTLQFNGPSKLPEIQFENRLMNVKVQILSPYN